MNVHIPLPPSHHHKNKQAREAWKQQAALALRRLPVPPGTIEILLDFYGPFLNAKGEPAHKQPDVKNLVWELEDFVADSLGYNDRRHFRIVATKHVSRSSYCTVELRPWRVLVT